jgi:Acyl-CoA dehydrogenase, N-terminal domain.
MEFGLSDEQRQIREEVRRFAKNEIAPVAGKYDREESYPPRWSRRRRSWG